MWAYIFFLSHLVFVLTQGAPLNQDQFNFLYNHSENCPTCLATENPLACPEYRYVLDLFTQQNQQHQSPPRQPLQPASPQNGPASPQNESPQMSVPTRFGLGTDSMPAPSPGESSSGAFRVWKPVPGKQSLRDSTGGLGQNTRASQQTGTLKIQEPEVNQRMSQQSSNVQAEEQAKVPKRGRGRPPAPPGEKCKPRTKSENPKVLIEEQRERLRRNSQRYRAAIKNDEARYERMKEKDRKRKAEEKRLLNLKNNGN